MTIPIFQASQSLDVRYIFNQLEQENARIKLRAAPVHHMLSNGYDDLLKLRKKLNYRASINKINIATAAVTLLYTDTSLEEGYLGETVESVVVPFSINANQRILSMKNQFTESSSYQEEHVKAKNKSLRDRNFNTMLSNHLRGYRQVASHFHNLNPIITQQALKEKIKDSNFHEAFHHSEQGIMFGLSQAQTIKHIVQLARQNNAVYFYGAMLDIYTPRTMCRHCNTGLIGIKNTHAQGFIHDLSARLTQKNIEPGGNDHLFLDVRVSATSPAQHTNLEPFKLTSDSNVVHEYSSEIAVRPILQALNSDVIRKRRKTPPEYYSGSFFSSRDFPCKKLEKALVNHPNFK